LRGAFFSTATAAGASTEGTMEETVEDILGMEMGINRKEV
jgi:hypothetical protein